MSESPSRLERSEKPDGSSVVSRGTWISDSPSFIECDDKDGRNPESKPDLFQTLPNETIARIVDEVERCALNDDYARLDKLDIRMTGWFNDKSNPDI